MEQNQLKFLLFFLTLLVIFACVFVVICIILFFFGKKVTIIELHRNSKGQFHRIGGPAIVRSNGYQSYWVEGKRHRLDGPAIIRPNGTWEYWVDDIQYTEEQYPQAVIAYKLKQLVG
jgi:hypothetical protein